MTPWLVCRSYMNTPAIAPERFEKGFSAGADMVSFDLEDSVPHEQKQQARQTAFSYIKENHDNRILGVRLNALSCVDGIRDLTAMFDSGAEPDIVMMPKVEHPEEVVLADKLFTEAGYKTDFAVIIESASGMLRICDIAKASKRVKALIFGAADFASDLGVELSWETLAHARTQVVMAAADAGVVAVDSPYFNIPDVEGLEREAAAAKRIGFGGKIVLHPCQVKGVNETFMPSRKTIHEAGRIVEASEKATSTIFMVDGQMIGPPFVKRARRVLEQAHYHSINTVTC